MYCQEGPFLLILSHLSDFWHLGCELLNLIQSDWTIWESQIDLKGQVSFLFHSCMSNQSFKSTEPPAKPPSIVSPSWAHYSFLPPHSLSFLCWLGFSIISCLCFHWLLSSLIRFFHSWSVLPRLCRAPPIQMMMSLHYLLCLFAQWFAWGRHQ